MSNVVNLKDFNPTVEQAAASLTQLYNLLLPRPAHLAEIYIHPKAPVYEAAIACYINGGRLVTVEGVSRFCIGRHEEQYRKALKCRQLAHLANSMQEV